ncbi:MAG: adenylate/guanylate cyclase domain-containing protein [Chitinophagaceae bacterium]|nr:MAG: adenylate/guanylate cyclase domain-containing protein [Chitinophagaceae bacterium]
MLSPPTKQEALLGAQLHLPANVRLACQAEVAGEGVIQLRRIIHDENDIGLYIGHDPNVSDAQLGEEKESVLFFLDIRNFTSFTETHLAFDVIHIIRKLFAYFNGIIVSNGGRILETTGDGLYATFEGDGNPVQAVQAAVQSGLSIIAGLEVLNPAYFVPHFGAPVWVGIGIHSGRVISGGVLLGDEEHTVVMGHAVNIAARLQNATKELNNSLLVSEDVYRQLIHRSATPPPSALLRLKGISEPMTVYLMGQPYPERD